jgi:MYXO-CTERM domain-containing protein
MDQNVDGCSVPRPGAPARGIACAGALVAAAAFLMRRRRR